MARKERSRYSRTLRIVMDDEYGYCQMCRTRITPSQRPLSDAERELDWPSQFERGTEGRETERREDANQDERV